MHDGEPSDEFLDTEGRVLRASVAQRLFDVVDEPTRIGRFVALRSIGSGGMGRVYAAYDERLDRCVAVKVLLRTLDPHEDRVLREAKAMGRLSHPNVAQVYEVGEHGGRLFIAMEYIDGETLDVWQAKPGRTWRDVVHAYRQAALGLAAAHHAGLIHRDFKPRNAMVDIDPDGRVRVRVLDFGLVRLADEKNGPSGAAASEDPRGTTDNDGPTGDGTVLGTPAYMAPEQFFSAAVTAAADQFSFCVALWEALYGQRPFSGQTLAELAEVVSSAMLPPIPSGSAVPGWVHRTVSRGLAARPEERFATMGALADALARDPSQTRMRWLVAAGGLVVLAGAGVGVRGWMQERAERCSGATEHLAGIWDGPRRAQIQAAMLSVDLPYAEIAHDRVATELEHYAGAWRDSFTDNCEATTFRAEQSGATMDLRMACLQRARVELTAVTAVLVDADLDVIDNASRLVGSLPPLSRCSDLTSLGSQVDPPPPAEAVAVDAIFASLAQARAAHRAGRYDQALAGVAEAKTGLDAITYAPIRTDVDLEEGLALEALGQYEQAEAALGLALTGASRLQQRRQLKDAAAMLMYVLGYRLHRGAEALQHRQLLEGLVHEPSERAVLHNSLATVFEAQGRFDESEAEYRNALALRVEALGADHPDTLAASSNVGTALIKVGRYAEAEDHLTALIARREAVLGEQHPHVAATRNSLANALAVQGRFAEAAEHMQAALLTMERRLGPSHPTVAGWRTNLGTAYFLQGRFDEAEAVHRRALALLIDTVGEAHPNVGLARSNLGGTLAAQGKLSAAEAEHRSAVEIRRNALGSDHPDVAGAVSDLAAVVLLQGRHAEAEPLFRDVLGSLQAALGPEHPRVAEARDNLAETLVEQGKLAEAEAEIRRALAVLEKTLQPDDPSLRKTRLHLVETLLLDSRAHEALALAETVWAGLPTTPDAAQDRADAAFVLAKVLWSARPDESARPRALQLAARAIEDLDETQAPGKKRADTIRAWLDTGPLDD